MLDAANLFALVPIACIMNALTNSGKAFPPILLKVIYGLVDGVLVQLVERLVRNKIRALGPNYPHLDALTKCPFLLGF